MSINSRIITALSPIAPTAPGIYTGDEATYIVFRYDSAATLFADNKPTAIEYSVQVHLFTPLNDNTLEARADICQRLYAAGFGWPTESDSTDENGQHYIFQCGCVEGL